MSTTAVETDLVTAVASGTTDPTILMSRIVSVELRKSFDTRSGFWLLASVGIPSRSSPPPR